MKKLLLIIALFALIIPAYCQEENTTTIENDITNEITYKKDVNYLLEKIGNFKSLFTKENTKENVSVIEEEPENTLPQINEEQEHVAPQIKEEKESIIQPQALEKRKTKKQKTTINAPIGNKKKVVVPKQEVTVCGVRNKLNCKQMKTVSMNIVKRNLTFREKLAFNKYMRYVKKTLSQIEYIGTREGLVQVKFTLHQDGTTSNARVYASTFNKDFNKQIIDQISQKSFMVMPVNIGGVGLQYQFDNIYK